MTMKLKYYIISTLVLILFIFRGYSQSTAELFMTKELKKSYQNKTRDMSGKPGINYWQNRADYSIKAEIIPEERAIKGKEIISYFNKSNDSLKVLFINLYQDIYKKGTARDWDIGPEDITDGVNISSLKINNISIDLGSTAVFHNASIMGVNLKNKINPKSTNTIEIQWSFKLPALRNIRMGTYNKTNFMVAYWYPKVAVYDDIYSWNTIPYVGNCEFYNNFGSFDVEITAPENFILWSSGLLQNTDELFTKNIQKRIEKAQSSDEIIHVINADDRKENNFMNKNTSHIWKFKAENLTDFAFAASDTYLWDATSIAVGNKRIWINTVYKSTSPDFPKVAKIAQNTIDVFSNKTPAIAYPFPQITIFNGSGGMEFPGMVNDGDSKELTGTLYVTSHEIGHSYFPFYTGLNEQKYAWMDEGLITYIPQKFVAKYTDDTNFILFSNIIKSYNNLAGSSSEIPLMISSTNAGQAYRFHAYNRSSVAFYMLDQYLGNDKFNNCLQAFSLRWNGKHPTPFDFFFTFNEIAGEDLAWFWKPWFFDLGYADLAIEVQNSKLFSVRNKGGFPVPIHFTVEFKDGSVENFNEKASIWKDGNTTYKMQFDKKEIRSVKLDTKLTPDAFPGDNFYNE